MAEQLKHFFSSALVRRIAASILAVHPAFPERTFAKQASSGLDALELLARGKHIADRLAAHLPAAYPEALDILVRSLGPVHASDELLGNGMAPFFYLPHTMFVAERGLDNFDRSMEALRELTKRFTGEFAIRTFLAHDPERTFRYLERWVTDPDPHVRRLVSEGTRPRLPWGRRVPFLDASPERIVALLAQLRDDPASLVRRSVANNLNDLSRLHAPLVFEVCRTWLVDATPTRRTLVEHALRTAIKRGEPTALALIGYGEPAAVAIEDIALSARVKIGARVTIQFTVRSTVRRAQDVLVDLVVHFVKASGATAPKVFKLDRVTLAPRAHASFSKSVSLAVHTTRKPRPGKHHVDVLLNGVAQRIGTFTVV